jgi:LuxR family maltose regulon positive regulatory protein
VALSGLGTAELWSGELDAAAEHLHAGHAAALGAGLDDVRLDCLSTLALVQAIGGQLSLAVQTGEAAVELAGQHAGAPTPVAGALLALAWASYQRDDLAAAAGYLERAVEGAAAAQDRSLRVAVKLLAGRLRHAQADPAGAFAELQLATDDVDPAGVVSTLSPFLDELAPASLDPAPDAVSAMPVLIESLSERERTVLRYLPTMLTFGEIGSELYISVNTTKSHVRSIYRKLGAVGRRDAVRRARQLQLLRS